MFFAGVGLILAEKTLEHLLFKRVRNTGAVIGNRQGNMIGSKGQCKGDMAGRRCVTEGIVHEDGEYLGESVLRRREQAGIPPQADGYLGRVPFPGKILIFFICLQEQGVGRYRSRLQIPGAGIRTGKLQHVINQA